MENTLSKGIRKKRFDGKQKQKLLCLLLVTPFILFVFAFSYVPLAGWILAFGNYKMGQQLTTFQITGVENFVRIFTDREMGRVMRNTLVMSFLGLGTSWVSIMFAIMLNEMHRMKVKKFVQTATTLPNFISWIVVYGFAFAFFSSNGLVNQGMKALGLKPSPFGVLGSEKYTWVFMLLLDHWKGMGWSAIIYLAAISGIDEELYDAAKVDGADRLQLIRHITIPGVLPTYLVILLLAVGNLISGGFEKYYIFWNPLIAKRIEVLDYYTYKIGFVIGNYSYSVAVGMSKAVVSIVLLMTVNWVSKRIRGNSLF